MLKKMNQWKKIGSGNSSYYRTHRNGYFEICGLLPEKKQIKNFLEELEAVLLSEMEKSIRWNERERSIPKGSDAQLAFQTQLSLFRNPERLENLLKSIPVIDAVRKPK